MQTGLFFYMGTDMKQVEALNIIDIGTNGDGIARLATGDVVFVPFTAAGDMVMAEVDKDQNGQHRARIDSFLMKSPMRVTPPCRHFGICGGCALQHINQAAYEDFKRGSVIATLQKAGLSLPDTIETVFILPHTRRRANFAARVVKGRAIIGFHERRSATIRDVPDCHLINDDVRRVMEAFRPFIPDIAGDGQKMDVLIQCVDGQSEICLTGKIAPGWEAQQALADTLRATGASRISLRAKDYDIFQVLLEEKQYYVRFGELVVNLAPGAFLQPSKQGEQALSDAVHSGVGDAPCVADLFCGNGTFTGGLLAGRDVVAADLASDAITAMQKAGVHAVLRNLFKEPFTPSELNKFDAVVIDPPRAGAMAQARELASSDVPKIVYVSCNPQSFAKDAKALEEGGYTMSALTIVDQFVWSAHTELVAVFEK